MRCFTTLALLLAGCLGASELRSDEDRAATEGAIGPDAPIASTVPCELEGVRTIEVPAVYGRSGSSRLAYRYRVFPSERAGAPTVVVVPGGPGGDIMRHSPSDPLALGAIPRSHFNVIYTDARGSGCNSYPELPEAAADVFRTEHLARDLLALVRHEGLDDYMLYGASYGSAQITVAAALAEQEGSGVPRRLVLEGPLGRAFDSFDAYAAAFGGEWERVEPLLPAEWTAALTHEPWPESLHWTREQWGSFVWAQLILGDLPGQGPILGFWLSGLSRRDPAAERFVATFMEGVGYGEPGTLFRTIACRELWGGWQTAHEIRDGALRAIGDDLCTGIARDAPYDAAAWQSSVPITYFHGAHDPTTTTAQAEYLFATRERAAQQLVVVPDASHASMTLGLAGRGCAAAVWRALDEDPGRLGEVLRDCAGGAPIELRTAPSRQFCFGCFAAASDF
jgi:pimeloyl-ACP methyl ester carboxylesterase